MPKTGEKCTQGGIYMCSIHEDNEIPISKGETFPPCPYDGGHGASWILIRPDK
ncbi:MAG: hypothetical protein RLO81_09735 [Fulvivirga sp.]|uniref:hypothetical protein n=1 Tax=Fulvivirga sp. TaxID=1931237 RepID=UPI0032EB2C58